MIFNIILYFFAIVGFLTVGILVVYKPEHQNYGKLKKILLFLISPLYMLFYGCKKCVKKIPGWVKVLFLILCNIVVFWWWISLLRYDFFYLFDYESFEVGFISCCIVLGIIYIVSMLCWLIDYPSEKMGFLLLLSCSIFPLISTSIICYGIYLGIKKLGETVFPES